MTSIEYRVQQGTRNPLIWGAGFKSHDEAMEHLLQRQLEGKRGLYIVKLVPYAKNLVEVVRLK